MYSLNLVRVLAVRNVIECSALLRRSITLTLACSVLVPTMKAVTPAPDGGYPGGNTAEGTNALFSLTTGQKNTAVGFDALYNNGNGTNNTATGYVALSANTFGDNNTANGVAALTSNTVGNDNTAIGQGVLALNTNGSSNTAIGKDALTSNVSGNNNTASGYRALYRNTTNATLGAQGEENTADGAAALFSNTIGYFNTATGFDALYKNTSGSQNTAAGVYALSNNTTGANNVAVGINAGLNLTTGSNHIVIGAGVLGAAGDANKIRIGKSTHTATYIGGVYNKTVASGTGVAVRVDSTGKLGTVLSSARYKDAIKPMDKASEAIHRLEPVSFRYKQELDPAGVTQFGLIAEQVEKVNPDLVVHDEDGKVSTVRYEAVNAMLLNEFLKEHRNVAEQQSTIAELKTTVAQQQKQIAAQQATAAQQQKQIEALIATVRKVSERVELSATAPQIAANED